MEWDKHKYTRNPAIESVILFTNRGEGLKTNVCKHKEVTSLHRNTYVLPKTCQETVENHNVEILLLEAYYVSINLFNVIIKQIYYTQFVAYNNTYNSSWWYGKLH